MKVFVTGGAGYIGSVCVEKLIDAGHQVTVFDDLSTGHRSAVHPRARFVHASLKDRERLEQAIREAEAEAVLHFAAVALAGESMADPGKYFRTNVAWGLNLLEAVVAVGVRKFVFSSSCATYGFPDQVPITESVPQRPINPYGESKFFFERMLQWYGRIHHIEFVALRYFNAAGATETYGEHHTQESHLIPNVLRVALGQTPGCEVFGTDYPTPDGTCIRDYIHVADLAQAHLLALQPGITGFFNLGIGHGYSVRQVVQACQQISGRPIKAVERPRRPGDAPKLVASAEKARRELGWTPTFTNLETIVESAWKWHQVHPQGYTDAAPVQR